MCVIDYKVINGRRFFVEKVGPNLFEGWFDDTPKEYLKATSEQELLALARVEG